MGQGNALENAAIDANNEKEICTNSKD